jgi:hypothetical protein
MASITLEGAKGLQDYLKKYGEERTREIRKLNLVTANNIKTEARRNLDRNHTNDAGNLKRSLVADTSDNWISAEVGCDVRELTKISPHPYDVFVEKGSRPHFPPSQALQLWVKRKLLKIGGHIKSGRKPKGSARGRNAEANEIKGIAFVVARAISRKGTKAQPFLMPAAMKLIPGYLKRLAEILGK